MHFQNSSQYYNIKHYVLLLQWVVSIDMKSSESADANVVLNLDDSWADQKHSVSECVHAALGDDKLDAVICVAGGWAGGNAASKG